MAARRRLQWAPAAAALLLFLLLAAATASAGRKEVVTSPHGAVAADDGRCSRIGRDALRQGGTAVDAAVAAALCLGVVSPASSGVGGGAFMLVRLADGTAVVYDSRETAPLAASKDMYGGNETLKARGALSIAVPGEIAGLYEAWRRHGKLPWKRLVLPSARLARAFRISPYLRMQMEATRDGILSNRGIRALYAPGGDLLKVGEVCRNAELARALMAVAEHGPGAFYGGAVGERLVKDVREAGGILTAEDLRKYRVKVRRPLTENVMGLEVVTMPPPSAGGAGMLLVLNILAQYGIPSGFAGSLGIHRLIESLKHYMAVKMNLGDPDFENDSVVVSDMMSPKFAAELKKTIYDNMTFDPKHYGGRPDADSTELVFQVEHPSGPWNQPLVHHRQRAKRSVDDQHRQLILRVSDRVPKHGHSAQQRDGRLLHAGEHERQFPTTGSGQFRQPSETASLFHDSDHSSQGWETEGFSWRQWRCHDPCWNDRGVPQPFRQEDGSTGFCHGAKGVSPADPERGPVRKLDDSDRRPLRARRCDEGRPSEERPRPEAARRGNHKPARGAQRGASWRPHRRE
ncbi:unnamed protein product [Urochloa humidicola]